MSESLNDDENDQDGTSELNFQTTKSSTKNIQTETDEINRQLAEITESRENIDKFLHYVTTNEHEVDPELEATVRLVRILVNGTND